MKARSDDSRSLTILVLARGWVVVGHLTRTDDWYHVENAHVIRKWGTERGLGQLALHGPTKDTVLDPCGSISAYVLTTVMEMPCHGWSLPK